MRAIERRVCALEGGPASPFADWSDAEISARLRQILTDLEPYGLWLPVDWQTRLEVDPSAFLSSINPQLESLGHETTRQTH